MRPDLTNVDEACERLGDTTLVQRLADRADRDLVASGEHTYAAFAHVVADDLPAHPGRAGLRLAAAAQDQAIQARPRI